MIPEVLALSLEEGGSSHLLEIGIIVSNGALILVSIMLTIVTALNDDAMVKIVRILHSRRVPLKRTKRTADSSTEDGGGDDGSTRDHSTSA